PERASTHVAPHPAAGQQHDAHPPAVVTQKCDVPSNWTLPVGWSAEYTPVTNSTNDDAKRAALHGYPDRSVFLADEQRHGRGRLGRSWICPPGTGLLFS